MNKLSLKIRLQRDDSIPAFGGYLACEPMHRKSHGMLMNVDAIMDGIVEEENGIEMKLTSDHRKRLIVSTLMHEFGHALENYLGLPVNESAIEKACEDWDKLSDWRKTLSPTVQPSGCGGGN